MKCFYHPNAEAVGICKSCAKGICIDCAADMGKGLACKQRCEVDVVRYTALLDSAFEDREIGRKTLRSNRRSRLSWSVFFLVLGGIILLSAYGLYIKGKGKEFQLAFFSGLFSCIYGLIGLIRGVITPVPKKYLPFQCQRCGYDLSGNPSGRCPDCGTSVL